MPIYEYKCDNCGYQKEMLQKMGADAPGCDQCSTVMTHQISRTSFQLKGSGWEADGYSGGRSVDEAMDCIDTMASKR